MILTEPCPSSYHGSGLSGGGWRSLSEFDPHCQTCSARQILSEHDHLHLGADYKDCQTPGIGGVPGQTVKCRCGSFHH